MKLQDILKKLKVNSIEEFLEREKKLDEKYKDCETTRNPLKGLTHEELYFFRDCVKDFLMAKSKI